MKLGKVKMASKLLPMLRVMDHHCNNTEKKEEVLGKTSLTMHYDHPLLTQKNQMGL